MCPMEAISRAECARGLPLRSIDGAQTRVSILHILTDVWFGP